MSDSCKHCTVRGDIKACVATPCHTHDSWYAKQLQRRIRELEEALHLIADTDPDDGAAWFHEIADKALEIAND